MSRSSGTACVNGNSDASVGGILEAGGHGEGGCEFTVYLGLCGAGTNSAPGDKISSVLRGDGIKEFAAGRETHLGDFEEEASSNAKALVDLETVVEVRIIDEALPADGGAGLLEVDAHDYMEVIFGGFGVFPKQLRVFEASFNVVDRARAV